jgi:hypothetical protein
MMLQPLNKFLILRRALAAGFAVLIALLVDHFYASTQQFWIPLISVLITQVSYDADVKKALQSFVIVMASVFSAALCSKYLHYPSVLYFIAGAVFVLCRILAKRFSALVLTPVAFIFLLLATPMFGDADMFSLLHDVVLGAFIGIAVRAIFFTSTLTFDFRQRIVLVLARYSEYLSAIGDVLLQIPGASARCQLQRTQLENVLQSDFPHWVYERGFNPILQQGHRHFLVRMEQLGEVLFALNFAVRHSVSPDLLAEFQAAITQSIAGVKRIIAAIIVRLRTEKFDAPVSDLEDEIMQLEIAYRKFITIPLELIDTSKDAIALSAYLYGMKDMQRYLIKVADALRL